MTTYQAAVFPAPNLPVEIREFPEPDLEPGAALLHTMYSEVCGTDVHLHHGKLSGVPYPIIPGHVSVGSVAKVRGKIRTVGGRPYKGRRRRHLPGRPRDVLQLLLPSRGEPADALSEPQGVRHTYSANDGLLGGWTEAIYMKPGVKMIHIPKELAPETFIGGGCGLVTALHAVDMSRIRLGESVAVMGVGPVGQSAVALASLSDAGEIVSVDGVKDRLEFAKRMGATQTISLDLPRKERLSRAHALTRSRGFDVVIECSGAPEAVSEALDLVRDGGRVVVCGHYTDNGSIEINPHWQINRKHVELRGCWGSRYEHFHRAVGIAATQGERIEWERLISSTYSGETLSGAFHDVSTRNSLKAIIAI